MTVKPKKFWKTVKAPKYSWFTWYDEVADFERVIGGSRNFQKLRAE